MNLAANQAAGLLAHLRHALGEEPDAQLMADALEGETDVFRLAGKLLDAIERDEGNIAALVAQIAARNERKAVAEKRVNAARGALLEIMEAAGLDKLSLPEATLSLRKVGPRPVVVDADAVPDSLCRMTRKPDMAAIKMLKDTLGDGAVIPGVEMSNGGQSLNIRKK